MTLHYTLKGKTVCITNRATAIPRKGDLVEINGNYLTVVNVVWHINVHTTEAEVQLANYH